MRLDVSGETRPMQAAPPSERQPTHPITLIIGNWIGSETIFRPGAPSVERAATSGIVI